MIEEEALWHELECVNSQQGSSLEGAIFGTVPSERVLSQVRVGPSVRQMGEEEFNSETEVVYSEEDPDIVETHAS